MAKADSIGDLFKGETWRSYGNEIAGPFSPSAWQGKYGMTIDDAQRIPLAHDILNVRAGGRIDFRGLSDADVESIIEGRLTASQIEARRREPQEDPNQPRPVPVPPANVRDRGSPCPIGPYSVMQPICAMNGQKAHHVVPDRTFRRTTGSGPRIVPSPS